MASQEERTPSPACALRGFGVRPPNLHRLPEMIDERRAGATRGAKRRPPLVDISFPEIEKFDRLPEPRAEGSTAFVSIMEGCSKYCSFCVVPYTRGEEISRPLEPVLAECEALARGGVREINLLGQNVNAYRGTHGRWRGGRPSGAHHPRGGHRRYRSHPLHNQPPHGVLRELDRGVRRGAGAGELPPSPGAVGLRSNFWRS